MRGEESFCLLLCVRLLLKNVKRTLGSFKDNMHIGSDIGSTRAMCSDFPKSSSFQLEMRIRRKCNVRYGGNGMYEHKHPYLKPSTL